MRDGTRANAVLVRIWVIRARSAVHALHLRGGALKPVLGSPLVLNHSTQNLLTADTNTPNLPQESRKSPDASHAKNEKASIEHGVIFRNHQLPGDVLMLTVALRDLHRCYPNQFQTDVRSTCPELWANSPYITPLDESDPSVRTVQGHYP